MRNLKKLAAVGLTAAMTMAMTVVSFGADVTIHFKNAANWDTVGAWIYQGFNWGENVTPQAKCAAYNTEAGRPIWPGAKMDPEPDYNGWYTVTATFNDTSNGAIMIFNNYVADTTADTSSGGDETDNQYLQASGLVMDSTKKQQTPSQIIKKTDFTATEYWCDFDGNVASSTAGLLSATAPASYVKTATETATTAAAGTSTTATTAAVSSTTAAPKTGDAGAYALAFTGLAAAAVVVASKKKVNE